MPETDKITMTDVPDEQLENAVRVLVNSQYERVLVEVQRKTKKKRTYRITAE
jgi:hypothetical protein